MDQHRAPHAHGSPTHDIGREVPGGRDAEHCHGGRGNDSSHSSRATRSSPTQHVAGSQRKRDRRVPGRKGRAHIVGVDTAGRISVKDRTVAADHLLDEHGHAGRDGRRFRRSENLGTPCWIVLRQIPPCHSGNGAEEAGTGMAPKRARLRDRPAVEERHAPGVARAAIHLSAVNAEEPWGQVHACGRPEENQVSDPKRRLLRPLCCGRLGRS